ncbi:MAG TPA: hypothetical protein VGE35_00435 [Candidatus Paceibacterota bacterium]
MRKRVKGFWQKCGWLGAAVAIMLALCVCMASYLAYGDSLRYSEAGELKGKALNFKDLSVFFADLAHEKGAIYAFEVLKRAPLPPNIDIHLLGHVVGDILYEQEGPEGIMLCTSDFRNACSHTIVIGTLLEKGPDSFSEIAALCRRAPGGSGAYTMCFHGLGHGVLAFNDYELPTAVKMCEKASPTRGREYRECVGGTIMEMISGVHDVEMWKEKVKKYFKDEDPLYPCSASFIPNEAKSMCYTYLTPHLFTAAGADLGRPDLKSIEKAFTYCDPLKGQSRNACFDGFGKEFAVLVQNRDIRIIESMTEKQMTRMLDMCELAKPRDGQIKCLLGALHSLFWGGENDPSVSLRMCAVAETRGEGKECYEDLIKTTGHYISDKKRRTDICEAMIEPYITQCKKELI